MTVRIGINPLTWTNDDMPELGGDTPLETCLREGREAGYAGFELGHKFPRNAAVLGPLWGAKSWFLQRPPVACTASVKPRFRTGCR
jgi:hypothetical protein